MGRTICVGSGIFSVGMPEASLWWARWTPPGLRSRESSDMAFILSPFFSRVGVFHRPQYGCDGILHHNTYTAIIGIEKHTSLLCNTTKFPF